MIQKGYIKYIKALQKKIAGQKYRQKNINATLESLFLK